jgi:hypothetical protein
MQHSAYGLIGRGRIIAKDQSSPNGRRLWCDFPDVGEVRRLQGKVVDVGAEVLALRPAMPYSSTFYGYAAAITGTETPAQISAGLGQLHFDTSADAQLATDTARQIFGG